MASDANHCRGLPRWEGVEALTTRKPEDLVRPND